MPLNVSSRERTVRTLLLVSLVVGSALIVGVGPVAAQPEATLTAGEATPEALDRGDTFTIEYRLTNTGDEDASAGGIQLTMSEAVEPVSLSGDGTDALGNDAVFYVDGIDAGETKRTTITFEVAENATPGDISVSAVGRVGDNVATTTSTASVAIFTGEVRRSDGDPATGDSIVVFNSENESNTQPHSRTEIDANGEFSVSAIVDTRQTVQYYQAPVTNEVDGDPEEVWYPTDGSPDMYALGGYDDPTFIGRGTLPEAYSVQVRVTDEDGEPVEDARVEFFHNNPSLSGGAGYVLDNGTNSNGYFEDPYSDGPGFELTGEVDVVVYPPEESNEFVNRTYSRNLTVTEPTTVTFELEESSVDRFDTDSDGTIEFGEVLTAISAFNQGDEIGGAPVTFRDMLDIIQAFNQGE